MAKKLVGHMPCPECSFADAEVGEDKNGNLYRHCTECNAQFFTRGDATRTKNLKAKMRPLNPGGDPAPVPVPPGPAPKKPGVFDGLFEKNKA